jgi:hypothetical protein
VEKLVMPSDIDELLEYLEQRKVLCTCSVRSHPANVAAHGRFCRYIAAVENLVANQLVVKHSVRPDFHLERDDGE